MSDRLQAHLTHNVNNNHTACVKNMVYAGAAVQDQGSTSRCFSIQPEDTVYGGPVAPLPKRVTLRTIQSKYNKKQPISMVTAYDYPSAVHVSIYPGVGM